MANQITNPESQEIDLSQMSRKIKSTISGLGDSFFNFILFIKRNIIIIAILIIAGVAIGYYLDGNVKVYNHKIHVIPNFNSNTYLYAEAEQLNNKLKENDYDFFKKIGVSNPEGLSKIEIEPIIDIYEFINKEKGLVYEDATQENINFQVFRLLSEKGDITKVMENDMTAVNYKQHLITITTNSRFSQSDLITPILNYFNSNEYFKGVQQKSIESLDKKMVVNDSIIKQIDNILQSAATASKNSGQGTVYINEDASLDKVIKIKDQLTREQAENQISKINYSKIVIDSSIMGNIRDFNATTGRMKYILPILLFLGYTLIFAFRSFFRKQVLKRKSLVNGQ